MFCLTIVVFIFHLFIFHSAVFFILFVNQEGDQKRSRQLTTVNKLKCWTKGHKDVREQRDFQVIFIRTQAEFIISRYIVIVVKGGGIYENEYRRLLYRNEIKLIVNLLLLKTGCGNDTVWNVNAITERRAVRYISELKRFTQQLI